MYKDCVNEGEGFIRLTLEEARSNLLDTLKRVMFAGQRIVLQQDGEEVAAIIPIGEFERLEYLKQEIKPSQYEPYEYEYYEDEGGIHCVDSDEVETEFDDILAEVELYDEIFGIMPPRNLSGNKFEVFPPLAILMNINNFWVPEYLISERNRLWTCSH
jgi:prevent-host-death family protein